MTRADPLEEPCAGQLACTVLQTSGGSDPFAEFNHAIKQFAHYRMIADGMMTESGLNNYLLLFSLYQTCRYKGVSFYRFLLSGEKDLDKFYESGQSKREVSSKDFKLIVPNAELVDF